MPMQINFCNDPITAPYKRVDITNSLSSNFNWSTLQLTAVGFNNTYISIPAGLQHYDTTVTTTENGETFEVLIDINLNPVTGVLSASLQSIDPTTNLPPLNPMTGFLPPEDGTGAGMGFLSYTIEPKGNLATGTQIRNVANISFDLGQTVTSDQVDVDDPSQGIDPTKQALITIDASPPVTSVSALPRTEPSTSFTVNWSGADNTGGAGIAFYNIYVSDNAGPFTLWQSDTTQTSATYTGVLGHTYAFYSVATDNVGNVEGTPTAAQATTTVASSPTSTVSALPAVTTNTSFTVSWSGTPGPGATSIASYTIYESDNGGPFTAFLSHTTLTSKTFTGQAGHTYGFYSVATDNLGAVQPTPSGAQATTKIAAPPSSTVSSLPATTTSTSFTVSWSGSPGAGATTVVSYDVFVSKDGGTYSLFQDMTTHTSATFTG